MAQPLSPLSTSDVLEWDSAQDTRNEFCRGAVFATGDPRRVHGLVAGNLSVALKVPFRGTPCRAFGVSMKVQLANDAVFYPDVFVTEVFDGVEVPAG